MTKSRSGLEHSGPEVALSVRLDPALAEALDRFVAAHGGRMSQAEALAVAFEDWASAHGYLMIGERRIRPEDLNASNDD